MRGRAQWGVMTWLGAVLGVTALVVVASGVHAQDLEPRAYANTPVGLNFLIAGYAYSEGGVTADPSVPLEDANVQIHTAVLAYVRSLDVWGKSGKFDVVLPYAWVSGSATFAGQPHQRDVSGFGDPRFRFSVNLYGSPPLSLKEGADYKQDVIVGAGLQVSAPGGRTTLDGVRGDDLQGNVRVGVTLALPVDRHNSIKLYGSTGVFARTGSDFNVIGIAWPYRWGGGL